MKTFKLINYTFFIILFFLASCSGGDDSMEAPEVVKSEISIDSNLIQNGLSFTSDKGEKAISFITNESWTLKIANTTSGTIWCTASATSGSKGSTSVKFFVNENTSYENRTVSVTIQSGTATKTFSISQKGADALLVTTDKYEISQEGGTIDIEVKANVEYTMEIAEENKDWIQETSRGLSTYKHTINIATNEEVQEREGIIYFKSEGKTEIVKIYQAGSNAVIILSQKEYTVSDMGETITVDISSNIDFDVEMPNVDWIVDEASSRGLSSHSLKYIIEPNNEYDNRSASIIFYDKNSDLKETLKIIQVQKDALILTQNNYEVKAEGETIDIELNTNIDYLVEIEENAKSWIIECTSRGLTTDKLSFTITANEEYEKREGQIIIKSQDSPLEEKILISQEGKQQEEIDDTPYLSFAADEAQTLSMSKAVTTLEYSLDGKTWNELSTTTVEFGGNKGALLLRGKSTTGTASTQSNYSQIIFGKNVPVHCSGDIRSLVDYSSYDTVDMGEAKFCYLFKGCTVLKNAPELPSEKLADMCYYGMFYGCTSLTTAPELPANKTSYFGYYEMFAYCTNLTTAPQLPATTLNTYCYGKMFQGCTSLTTAPQLPAATLAESCYSYMFQGCTSLSTAPQLPATTLASSCYSYMFQGCTSLSTAPQLPATTLANSCYDSMFAYCTSLKAAPQLPATSLDIYCYKYMFRGCTGLTTAPQLPATQLAQNCYTSMFSECTSLKNAPKLPATTLDVYCYSNMFYGCTSLENVPEISATTMAAYSCQEMFRGCTQLSTTPELPATTLADGCYKRMFYNCTNLETAYNLPALTLKYECYYAMFSGCTKLKKAPELPATSLASSCYKYMFKGCTSLSTAPKLPATNLSRNCYECMFENCTSLSTAPELPASKLADRCYDHMFYLCKNLSNVTMLATDVSANKCLDSWLYGVSSTGTFTQKNGSPVLPSGSSGVPKGWEIKLK